jgi:hypothetical protein
LRSAGHSSGVMPIARRSRSDHRLNIVLAP